LAVAIRLSLDYSRHWRATMTMEEIASNSIVINRNLRIALHELLDMAEGAGSVHRGLMVPKIKAALEASEAMPTAHDVINAKGGLGR
jgi:hypothetical protein